ncbi:hypothetical protein [Mycobacteroides saopaulense]|uniref:hypothetical protein n=1 Tax=Mycobacteroides saopaulense TaxID=1578165 RepID=UPI0013F4DDD9|nr:hypothetical protein [Mycobacteroides saopaulense]
MDEIKCNVLRHWLEKALADINVLLNGLAAIGREPMSARRSTPYAPFILALLRAVS